jgi:hypothetical protein
VRVYIVLAQRADGSLRHAHRRSGGVVFTERLNTDWIFSYRASVESEAQDLRDVSPDVVQLRVASWILGDGFHRNGDPNWPHIYDFLRDQPLGDWAPVGDWLTPVAPFIDVVEP